MASADPLPEAGRLRLSVDEEFGQGPDLDLNFRGGLPAAGSIGCRGSNPKRVRFGFHNLRHSLSNWLVNKRKENPKTVQGILRHARIQTTLDLWGHPWCSNLILAGFEAL